MELIQVTNKQGCPIGRKINCYNTHYYGRKIFFLTITCPYLFLPLSLLQLPILFLLPITVSEKNRNSEEEL
ncbi:MAG: hypothetical protein H0U27_12395 [Nitrosopumilus sp.]|nr:hypothetical protein [Nitrosopumilus sp.]